MTQSTPAKEREWVPYPDQPAQGGWPSTACYGETGARALWAAYQLGMDEKAFDAFWNSNWDRANGAL